MPELTHGSPDARMSVSSKPPLASKKPQLDYTARGRLGRVAGGTTLVPFHPITRLIFIAQELLASLEMK